MRLAAIMKFLPSAPCQIIYLWKAFFKWNKKVYGTIKEIKFPTSTLPQCLVCLNFFNFDEILHFDCNYHTEGIVTSKFEKFKFWKKIDFASMLSMLIKKINTSKSLLYNVSSIIYYAAKNQEIWLIFEKNMNRYKIRAKPILMNFRADDFFFD